MLEPGFAAAWAAGGVAAVVEDPALADGAGALTGGLEEGVVELTAG